MYRFNCELFTVTLFAGKQLCMNSPVDKALLQLVHHNVYSLENKIKNWPEELKEEKHKVQQQLQTFRSETEQRLAKLETEQQRLKTGHQRLENEQQRLDSHSRNVEQRLIKCEGTLNFVRKKDDVNCCKNYGTCMA